jgi:peptidoglycan/LPS O-acetylase OafA/YrhL
MQTPDRADIGPTPLIPAAAPRAVPVTGSPSSSLNRADDTPASTSHPHVPALDGLRGLAILLVLFYHFLWAGGGSIGMRLIQKTWGFGWIGVDLFFVLSGFLITGILVDAKAHRAGHYFRNFYARRTVRIFPLYFAFLAVMLILLPRLWSDYYSVIGVPPVGDWAYWLYVYNWFQGHHAENFSHSLGVTWSLCIEEQFYLVWPAVVYLCSTRAILRVCAALLIVSPLTRLVMILLGAYPAYIEQWSICRMEGLAVGAGIAVLLRTRDLRSLVKPSWWILALVPALTIGINVVLGSLKESNFYTVVGVPSIAALGGAMLLLTITSGPTAPVVRFFSHPMMRMLGRYSYAIYLFNQPIKYTILAYVFDPDKQLMVMGSKVPAQLLFFLLCGLLTLGMAMLSWNMFEKHFLKLKILFPMEGKRPSASRTSRRVAATVAA